MNLVVHVILKLFEGCHQRAPKAKRERVSFAYPCARTPQLEPAQKEVDKTTNVKAKKKKVGTTFNEQQKEEIIEFL